MDEANIARKQAVPWKLLILAPVIGLAIFLAIHFDLRDLLRRALDGIAGLGIWGPVIFVLLYIVASVLFVPASLLTLGAGALFGIVRAVCA